MIPSIIKKLNSGLSIALISDSGTPIISDPGSDLVQDVHLKILEYFQFQDLHLRLRVLYSQIFQRQHFRLEVLFLEKKNILLKKSP